MLAPPGQPQLNDGSRCNAQDLPRQRHTARLFNLKQRIQSLRMVAGLAAFLKNPGELGSVFSVLRRLQGSPLAVQMQRHLLANPSMAALVESHWRPAPIDLEALSALAQIPLPVPPSPPAA